MAEEVKERQLTEREQKLFHELLSAPWTINSHPIFGHQIVSKGKTLATSYDDLFPQVILAAQLDRLGLLLANADLVEKNKQLQNIIKSHIERSTVK